MSKPILKTEMVDISLKLDRAWVDRIDEVSRRLSMTRNGVLRLLVKLGAPITDAICQTLGAQLEATCARIDQDSVLFALELAVAQSKVPPNERRTRSRGADNVNPDVPAASLNPQTIQSRRSRSRARSGKADLARAGKKIARQADAKGQAVAGPQAATGDRGRASGRRGGTRRGGLRA